MILSDTQTLYWWREDRGRLGTNALVLLDESWDARNLAASAISFWEIGMLESKGRLSLPVNADQWRLDLLNEGLAEIPSMAESASALPTWPTSMATLRIASSSRPRSTAINS